MVSDAYVIFSGDIFDFFHEIFRVRALAESSAKNASFFLRVPKDDTNQDIFRNNNKFANETRKSEKEKKNFSLNLDKSYGFHW